MVNLYVSLDKQSLGANVSPSAFHLFDNKRKMEPQGNMVVKQWNPKV